MTTLVIQREMAEGLIVRFTRGTRLIHSAGVVLVAVMATLASLVMAPGPANAAPPTASLALAKNVFEPGTTTPLTRAVEPGQSFDYQLSAACSGLTQGCINAKTVDVIPAGITIQVPPSQPPLYTVSYVAATRTLTITYTDQLASPPNPAGSQGIQAGSTRVATIHATLDANTTLPDGATVTNTAKATADNADPVSDSAAITVAVPRRVTPVASKSFSSSSLVAQSGATTTATLGIRNSSSSSADVTSLTVSDVSKNTWDDFNLSSLGPIQQLPAGADQVSVQYCTAPAPCAPGQFVNGPFVPGPDVTLPTGVDPATVTGIRFEFSNSHGTTLPVSTTGGTVPIGLTLRNTVRSTGAPLDPTAPLNQTNCASPSAVDTQAGRVGGTDACAHFTVQPAAAQVAVSKTFFPDANGSYAKNGYAVAGQSSGVSAITTAKNTSAFPVTNLTIVEPSATSPTDFGDVDTTSLRLVFPPGATAATGTVTCRDGTSIPISATATGTVPVGCAASRIAVTYTGAIPAGASGQLGVHGTLNGGATGGSTHNNCADGSIAGGTQGGATGTGCAPLPVENPRTTVNGIKNISAPNTGGKLVPGQPMTFILQASNSGNLPENQFTVTDPDPASSFPNPFSSVRLTGASVTTAPAALARQFVIEVLHGTTWVPYAGGADDAALGIRARLNAGLVQPTNTVTLSFSVLVRDGVPVGTSITNCQRTTVASGVGQNSSGGQCAPALTVDTPNSAGQVNKLIQPASVARPIAGVPPQTAQVQLRAQNTGNVPMSRIVITDPDETQDNPNTFFDAVNLASIDGVNFPPGADRVQVDACTSVASCLAGTYVNGTPATSAALPAGVAAADVLGLRFTFTSSTAGPDDFRLNPGSNFPTTGPCKNATVCFSVTPRLTLRSAPTTQIPDSLTNIATAGGVSPISNGQLVSFGDAPAPLAITKGTVQLGTTKTAVPSSVGPGTPIGYTLTTRNTGTGIVPALVVTEPIPAGLVFDSTFAGDNGLPYAMTSTVPTGTPSPPQPAFTLVTDPVTHSVTSLTWQFPEDYAFLPGSSVSFQIQATLAPGTTAGTRVSNTFGASTTDTNARPELTCQGGAAPDATLGCTATAAVTAQSGSAIDAQKWVHGDDSRGFYNTRTNTFVPIGDPACPLLTVEGNSYTRFPCVALILAGQNFSFLLNLTNVGTTPAIQSRIVDDLPKLGDKGVIVPSGRGTEWDPRPALVGDPTIPAGQPGALSSLGFTDSSPGCVNDLSRPPTNCPAGAWSPARTANSEAFRAFVDFATPLSPAQSTQIIVPMRAPANLDTTANNLPIAWNSFAHTDFFRNPNGSITQLQAVEPIKVGIAMPFGDLQIDKLVTGDIPPGSLIGPFAVAYRCVVTTAGGDQVEVAAGSGSFSDTAPLAVKHVPAGAVCTVHETDAGGGTATDPAPVTITPDTDPDVPSPTSALVVNDFPAPRLIVTKAVAGDAASLVGGPFVIRVDCQVSAEEVGGYPRDLTFNGAGSQSITDLPIGATCTVSEPDDHGATSTSTTYSDVNGHQDHVVIHAQVDAVAALTNTYDPASLTASKTVVGPGSAGPYAFTAACTLTSNAGTTVPVTLKAADAQFTLSNGQSRTITVPQGASCAVTEAGQPAGDTVTYNGGSTAATVHVDGTSTLDVVNTFAPATPPPPTTPPTSPPTSPAGPVTSQPSATGGGLAFTGASVLGPLAGGLLLVGGGFALWLVGRRWRRDQ